MLLVVYLFIIKRKMDAVRNNDALDEALRMLAGSIGKISQANAGNRAKDDKFRALGKF